MTKTGMVPLLMLIALATTLFDLSEANAIVPQNDAPPPMKSADLAVPKTDGSSKDAAGSGPTSEDINGGGKSVLSEGGNGKGGALAPPPRGHPLPSSALVQEVSSFNGTSNGTGAQTQKDVYLSNGPDCVYSNGEITENGQSRNASELEKASVQRFLAETQKYGSEFEERMSRMFSNFSSDMMDFPPLNRVLPEAPDLEMPDVPCFCNSCKLGEQQQQQPPQQ